MTHLKPQTAVGGLTLITLLLAGTDIGRVMGIGFDQSLYLTVFVLIATAWLLKCFMLKQVNSSDDDAELKG